MVRQDDRPTAIAIVVWKTGFWGEQNDGWYDDLLYLLGDLVIAPTGGGALTLV